MTPGFALALMTVFVAGIAVLEDHPVLAVFLVLVAYEMLE